MAALPSADPIEKDCSSSSSTTSFSSARIAARIVIFVSSASGSSIGTPRCSVIDCWRLRLMNYFNAFASLITGYERFPLLKK